MVIKKWIVAECVNKNVIIYVVCSTYEMAIKYQNTYREHGLTPHVYNWEMRHLMFRGIM